MGSLLVVSGPPGAGKSTVSEMLVAKETPGALVEGDRFFEFLRRGAVAPWLAEADAQNMAVGAAAAAATGQLVRAGYATVYDGVLGPWSLDAFASGTGLTELDYVMLLPDVDTCVARVMARSGHGFREEPATRWMHAQFAEASIDRRHVLSVSTAEPAAEVAARIEASRRAGTLHREVPLRP